MKLEKKDIIFWVLISVVVIALALILTGKKDKDIADFSATPTPEPILTTSPENTPAVQLNSKPKPEIIAEEVNTYKYWFNQLDSKSRVLGIYDECSYLVPSNVAYKNNTSVMLDNTRSARGHVLKIGPTDYPLAAGDWKIVTLSGSPLPFKMTIFCENIELGQIDLE